MMAELDRQDRPGRTGQAERERQNGQAEQERQNGQAEQERQNGTGSTEKTERDRQNWKDRTGQAEQKGQKGTGKTGKTERDRQNKIFLLLYRFEDDTFCDFFFCNNYVLSHVLFWNCTVMWHVLYKKVPFNDVLLSSCTAAVPRLNSVEAYSWYAAVPGPISV
jgi:hypothetical protein